MEKSKGVTNLEMRKLLWKKNVDAILKKHPYLTKWSWKNIYEVTHGTGGYDHFVFWINSKGRVFDAKSGHTENFPGKNVNIRKNPNPKGWLRGRSARLPSGQQIIFFYYITPEEVLSNGNLLEQIITAIENFPIPIDDTAIAMDNNANIIGTVADLYPYL